jgi:hypothetical protein
VWKSESGPEVPVARHRWSARARGSDVEVQLRTTASESTVAVNCDGAEAGTVQFCVGAGTSGSVVATQTFENPETFPASSNVRSTKE